MGDRVNDKELIERLRHNAGPDGEWGEMADSLQREAASRLEALVAERNQAKANLVALEDEKNAYINYVGDALGQADDRETLWDAAQRVLSERDALRSSLARAQEELRVAEDALRRHGYRKSCDIPACNCGDQWNHGGHAVERLREISEALPYANGKTLLQRVQELVSAHEEIEGLRAELASVLDDWNALVKASGSLTNGVAIGHVEGLRRDAERYRWLRKAREHWDILHRDDEDSYWADLHGSDLDAAIDSAMGAQK